MSRLHSEDVTLAYGSTTVVHDVSLSVPDGQVTTIIGPNGCGKSTLLRALVRLMKPAGGAVILDGQMIHRLPTREVARRLGLLQQQAALTEGITVEDLARRGRYPHQSFLQPPSAKDAEAVERALELTGMLELRTRQVDQLSGGQRQRAWIALALAQETPLLLLDEPTTYLDIAHQMEVLELLRRLNVEEGRTIVMVLHDVNEAARASDRIVAMKDGRILREGPPAEVVEPDLLRTLYGIECDVVPHPVEGHPFCVPRSREAAVKSSGSASEQAISVRHLRSGYGKVVILPDISLDLPLGSVTAIVGPNACGKSTLLRTIGRLLNPMAGAVTLDGRDALRGSRRTFARRLAILTQGAVPPAGFLVEDLVAAGRFPHQGLFRQWTAADEAAIGSALTHCELDGLRYHPIETLSGGQRQRAWVALALAQETPIMLLDEPTTFLDLAHQVELLDLIRGLNREQGRTVVMVLHDLNLAARYADLMVAMKDGRVVATGAPRTVLTRDLLRDVFEIDTSIVTGPHTGNPLVLPIAHARRAAETGRTPAEAALTGGTRR